MTLSLLITVIIVALVFEYINGFHDSANAIATVVSTQVLTPRQAILMSAVLNFVGAFFGTHVAKMIGSGLVDTSVVTQQVILAALLSAIIWNLFTWYYGIPSSSSHALIGGLLGSAMYKGGTSVIHFKGLTFKVLIPMLTSPLVGLLFGFLAMVSLLWIFHKSTPTKMNTHFRKAQLFSSCFMAFSHGSNDAQKTMGIITLSLFSYGSISAVEVPGWVVFLCALFMGLGTMGGGWKIIKTMGSKVIKLRPVHGFAAETSAAVVILLASHAGIPLSTTHVISTSIMGVGLSQRTSAMKWGLVGRILQTWIFTIPVCMGLAWGIFAGIDYLFK